MEPPPAPALFPGRSIQCRDYLAHQLEHYNRAGTWICRVCNGEAARYAR